MGKLAQIGKLITLTSHVLAFFIPANWNLGENLCVECREQSKCMLNFEMPQCCVWCCQFLPVVFILTAFFSNLLCSWVEVLMKKMVKGKIQLFNNAVLYFSWIYAHVNIYMHFPCHSPDILKAEQSMDCIHLLCRFMSSMQKTRDSFPPLKLN